MSGRRQSLLVAAAVAAVATPGHVSAETSAGGGRLAVVVGNRLLVMNADGTHTRVVARRVAMPSWSPDGRRLAVDDRGSVALVDANERHGRLQRIAHGNAPAPDWSPDGRRIAFGRDDALWIVDIDGGRERRIVRTAAWPRWSPDGRTLAFLRRGDIWAVDLANHNERRILRDASSVSWSPDGTRLAFTRQASRPPPNGDELPVYTWVARRDGGAQRRVGECGEPTWSPDGRELACISGERQWLVVMSLDGAHRHVLVRGQALEPDWSPE